jgi:WD40 repeat protein
MRTQDDFVIVDVQTGAITFDVKAHSSPWSSVALSPDGKSIYASTVYNSVRRWNSGDGQEADVWQGIDDFVFGGTFSPDLTRFASAGFRGIGLVNLTTGSTINQFDTETFCIQAITFSPDGKSLASADRGDTTSTIKLWDVATQKLIRAFDASKNWIGYLVFSLDGKWIASASREGAIEVWDTTTGKLHSRYDYGLWALALAFSPDSRLLAVGGGLFTEQEAVIRIVDLNGHEQTSLPAHSLSVYALAFSPNGTVLAAANGEGSLSLWDVSAARELNRLQGASIGESALLFNEQGNLLISAGDDGVVRLWGVFADIF